MPTPAVACLSAADGVPAAMISASHNPFADNGIKFFAPGGHKLTDDVEAAHRGRARRAARRRVGTATDAVTGAAVGAVGAHRGRALGMGRARSCDSTEGRTLDGATVVLDCANGAASALAPERLRAARRRGRRDPRRARRAQHQRGCGSTHPERLRRAVVAPDAALGFAFDGDADRVLAVDRRGASIDGDQLIAISADRPGIDRGDCADDTVVVTVMSNLGFRLAMADAGITVVETGVGDRYVLEALDAGGFSLGGEQSGHLIFRDLATTGDGAAGGAVQSSDIGGPAGPSAGRARRRGHDRLPQVLAERAARRRDPDDLPSGSPPTVRRSRPRLGGSGSVLVRPSGTEPLVRVMVEAPDRSDRRGDVQPPRLDDRRTFWAVEARSATGARKPLSTMASVADCVVDRLRRAQAKGVITHVRDHRRRPSPDTTAKPPA